MAEAPVVTELIDLDARPELSSAALAALAAHGPGQHHLVNGFAHRMGQPPLPDDLRDCLGVILAVRRKQILGVLALCPYSRDQATIWGPTMPTGSGSATATLLVAEAKRALGAAGFDSARVLADTRNRPARAFLLSQGFAPWKDNLLYECRLETGDLGAVRLITPADRVAVTTILTESFPDSDHCRPGLGNREREGWRHYLIDEGGVVAGAAAVRSTGRRSWLHLIAVRADLRVRQLGSRLMKGVLAAEAQLGMATMGLEVLADNSRAIALYGRCGFQRKWSATVMTAPV
jgi:GNAT superfamily N-acetyltransferase